MRRLLSMFTLSFVVAACSGEAEPSASSDDAIIGSLADARACHVAEAYRAATPTDFEFLDPSALPFPVTGRPSVVARFDAGVGKVFVVENDGKTTFYTPTGDVIATRNVDTEALARPNGQPLSCAAPSLGAVAPASVVAGAPDTVVRVMGSGFDARSVARLDGQTLPTTFVNGTRLAATVSRQWLSGFGRRAVITVATPGKPETVGVGFELANPQPKLGVPSPLEVFPADFPGKVVSVPGAGLVPGTIVVLRAREVFGSQVIRFATTFVSPTLVTFPLDAQLPDGVYDLCVETPAPGGGTACFQVDPATGNSFRVFR